MVTVARPRTLDAALDALRELDAVVIAGGTDLMVERAMGRRVLGDVVAVRRVAELRQLRVGPDEVCVGAAVTYSRLTGAGGLAPDVAPVLYAAASSMGSTQVRSMGTLGGNVGTASPVGDSLCALIALDARATVANAAGVHTVPVADLIHPRGGSRLAPGDLLVDLRWSPAGGLQRFRKVCRRGAVSRSVVSAAVTIDADGVTRIVIGGCGPAPLRMIDAERLVEGSGGAPDLAAVAAAVEAAVTPLDDVAGSAAYRRHAAGVLVRRALTPDTAQVQAA